MGHLYDVEFVWLILLSTLLLLSLSSSLISISASEPYLSEATTASKMAMVGGVHDSLSSENSVEIENLGRFAVDHHNKKENALLEFTRVVKAQEQVVAGTLHHLIVEAVDAGEKKLYNAKIWVKPWLNFKEIQEFKQADDVPSFTPSDLGVKKDGHGMGWQTVSVQDPVVQDAANHAVKTIQQRSNSLFPYKLEEILYAKAEVIEGCAKFDILLKLKRQELFEQLKVVVHKNNEGVFHLNLMENHHA